MNAFSILSPRTAQLQYIFPDRKMISEHMLITTCTQASSEKSITSGPVVFSVQCLSKRFADICSCRMNYLLYLRLSDAGKSITLRMFQNTHGVFILKQCCQEHCTHSLELTIRENICPMHSELSSMVFVLPRIDQVRVQLTY